MTETGRPPEHSPLRITRAQQRWLETESARWSGEGLLSPDQTRAILDRYESAQALSSRRSRRLSFVLTGMAVLMAAAGVLLLIGHNWDEIPRAVKVAMIFSAVAASFAGSALAYARGRAAAGEILALAGTLLYGNAIWLLAQVFHIRAHYPNGVLWWWIGALLTAHAVRSAVVGVEAAVLLAVWAGMESVSFESEAYGFWIGLSLILVLARRLESAILAVLGALGVPIWLLFSGFNAWSVPGQTFVLSLLAGCAIIATAVFWRRPALEEAWTRTGLAIVLVSMIPLTFTDYHDEATPFWREARPAQALAAGALLVGFAVAGWIDATRRGRRTAPAIPIVAAASALALLAPIFAASAPEERSLVLAVLFSATSVLVAVWEIQRGVASDEGRSFFTGVLYLLAFVLIRWVDLIGDMVSSAALFFIAALVLWATARYWQGRRRREARAGEALRG